MIQIILKNEAICPMCARPALDGRTHPRCQMIYGLDGLTSFFRYRGVVQKAIKVIKYRLVYDIASEFVNLVPRSALPSQKSHNLIPIPLHKSRLQERGFNQAEVLGRYVSQRLKIPVATDVLVRKRRTVPQVEMKDREKRLTNMANVFVVQKSPPSHLLLFDDVFTTGATMRSAADVLKRAGAKTVWAVTMAR